MITQEKISVVLPVRDEAPLVKSGIMALTSWLEGLSWEFVIIDLGSTDGSAELLEPFAESENVKLVLEEDPLGKGYAHRLGALLASGSFILLADLCRPMNGAPLISFADQLDQAEIVLFTPLHPEGQGGMLRDRLAARFMRRSFNAPAGTAPLDPDGGVILVKKQTAFNLFPLCDQAEQLYTYELLQLAVLDGHSVIELPIDARRWPRAGWLELGQRVRDARRVRQGFSARDLPYV